MTKTNPEKNAKKRNGERRKLLLEKEFRNLIETGKATEKDRRAWEERRRK